MNSSSTKLMVCALAFGVWAIFATVDTRIPTIYALYNRVANWVAEPTDDSNPATDPVVQPSNDVGDDSQPHSPDNSTSASGGSVSSPDPQGDGD